ncbi:hypothetical protein C5167_001054 [Papaver somniferum]|uniref:TRAF-type domain-containing protein n=1 Tax=Papaver somniferum TaxID=3469 RepID=A0A4Y7KUB2_PAPSO|nr:uncharacterized protein LOC113314298 [Papaver somniferum]RZC76924.1 hypothetical protein C5167_001054 [Papaver somniferum]
MERKLSSLVVVFFIAFIAMEAAFVQSAKSSYPPPPPASTPDSYTCPATVDGRCSNVPIICPPECPLRKPTRNKKDKGCYIDCTTCEATCKFRKANCDGYGSVCYDPRFVGGDGVMFNFHGATGSDFALVTDDDFQINAHFIGTRPQGRTRDFTWIQALSVMFDTHNLVLAAKRVAKWDDKVDSLIVRWDGEKVEIPADGEAEWGFIVDRKVVVERTADTNSVRVTITGLVEMDVRVTPIGDEENRVHKYQIPSDDVFAHLETQFKFKNLSDSVDGVLGRTYQPGYVSPVKVGVAMPMMGGEEHFKTPSLLSPLCKHCRFKGKNTKPEIAAISMVV